MAKITGMYNPDAEAQQDFSPIPSNEYVAQITDSDMKPVKPPKIGEYLELEYVVLEGEFKGRKVWARLNLDNPNQQTVEIANRQMATIREATGVPNPDDSQELHYKPHIIRVELIPAGTKQNNGYVTQKDSNEIRAWKKLDGGSTGAEEVRSVTTATPAANAGAAPWLKNKAA